MPTPSASTLHFSLNPIFADLLSALNARGAKYLVIGGYAVGAYTQPRATKDLDIFILCSEENSKAVFTGLAEYGAPLADYSPADFNDHTSFFTIGNPPFRVDVLQAISGVAFETAWEKRIPSVVNGELDVFLISPEHLIMNKEASGREQDLLDAKEMKRSRKLIEKFRGKQPTPAPSAD